MAKRQIRRNSGRQPAQNNGQSARRVQAVDGDRRQQQTRPAPQTGSRSVRHRSPITGGRTPGIPTERSSIPTVNSLIPVNIRLPG